MSQPNSSISDWIDTHLPPARQEEIRQLLKWSKYQWTWHKTRPRRWPLAKVVVFAKAIGMSTDSLMEDYGMGAQHVEAA